MSEVKKEPEKEVAKGYTKMTNVSKRQLHLACGLVQPGETVAFNVAEYSMLHLLLEPK